MSYHTYVYEEERPKLFTDEGQRDFLKIRDHAKSLLRHSGAATLGALVRPNLTAGVWDSFFPIACVDRLVELGELRCVSKIGVSQDHVYVAGDRAT